MNSVLQSITKDRFVAFILAIFCLKIILAALFSSDYQDKMFIPFVSTFFSNIFTSNWNVYQFYFEQNISQGFPYPPLMLIVELLGYAPVVVLDYITGGGGQYYTALQNLAFKTPIFIFDVLCALALVKTFPSAKRYIAVLYFANPIILYSSYMHGQLDIIPTTLLILSLYKLRRLGGHSCNISAILFALAVLTKTHILAALPLVLIFVMRKFGFYRAFIYACIVIVVSAVGILPFMSQGLTQMVFFNAEQNVLTQLFVQINSVKVFVPILAVIIIYFVASAMRVISDELLVCMCGILFSCFLFLCKPMPGWFVWITPFITSFLISVSYGRYNNIFAYALLCVFYCVYFVFFHKSQHTDLIFLGLPLDFVKMQYSLVANVIFTCMAGILLYLIWQMYSLGISMNTLYKRRNEPFTIGISGDSGSGKSHFVEIMQKVLGIKNLQCIEGDGDHRWERGEKYWQTITHLNPNANYLYRQSQNLISLRKGASIQRVDYDHSSGKFTQARRVRAKRYLFLCGLHSLYLPQTRAHLDLKVYIDTQEDLRRFWKVQRDVKERGHSLQKVLDSINARMNDAQKFIYPQKEYADIIVRYFDPNLQDYTNLQYIPTIAAQIIISSSVDLEPLINILDSFGIQSKHEFSQDLEKQTLGIDKLENIQMPLGQVAQVLMPNLDEITIENLDNLQGDEQILALVILMMIDQKMR